MDKKHAKCWLWKVLWAGSLISLGLAWLGVLNQSLIFGLGPEVWLWDALILGVLSIPIKLDCQNCSTCSMQ